MKKEYTQEELQKRKRQKNLVKFGCLPIGLLFIILMIAFEIDSENTDHFKTDKTSQAYVVSKDYIRTMLTYPEEAKFGMIPVLSEIQENTDSIYRVVGDVTSKNAFGVKSKHRYMLRMKYIGGDPLHARSWEVIDYSIPGIE